MIQYPERIVCLTEETTETLYLLGEEDRIVGISGFTVRPARACKEKPKVSAFTSAKIDKILALQPDLVFGFSDIQADIAAELVRAGIEVHIFNHRTVAGILRTVATVGAMIGCADKAKKLAGELAANVARIEAQAAKLARRPRVYFEEWDDPHITGIGWVAELIRSAGGDDIFPELATESLAKNRILKDGSGIIQRKPDIIMGSWCGKKFRPEKVSARPGFANIPAVKNGDLFEVKSSIILQPGPAALSDGIAELHRIISDWSRRILA